MNTRVVVLSKRFAQIVLPSITPSCPALRESGVRKNILQPAGEHRSGVARHRSSATDAPRSGHRILRARNCMLYVLHGLSTGEQDAVRTLVQRPRGNHRCEAALDLWYVVASLRRQTQMQLNHSYAMPASKLAKGPSGSKRTAGCPCGRSNCRRGRKPSRLQREPPAEDILTR